MAPLPEQDEEYPDRRTQLAADIVSAIAYGAIAMIVTYVMLRPDELRRVGMRLRAHPMTDAQARTERAVQELRRDLNRIEHSWPLP